MLANDEFPGIEGLVDYTFDKQGHVENRLGWREIGSMSGDTT